MEILAKVGSALQRLFGEVAETAAAESDVIQRTRKFTPLSLARTFVLGFLQTPNASDEKLAQMAVQCGAAVTPQAIEQRYTPRLVDFLERLFRRATKLVVGSDQALAPILERFTTVTVLDSSTISLPDEMQEPFQGCGGSYDGGESAMKLQTELDLRSGALGHMEIDPGRSPDGATSRQAARHGQGALRIADLGHFALPVLAAMAVAKEYFLSRLQFGTYVLPHSGKAVEVLRWLMVSASSITSAKLPPSQPTRSRLRQEPSRRSRTDPPTVERRWSSTGSLTNCDRTETPTVLAGGYLR